MNKYTKKQDYSRHTGSKVFMCLLAVVVVVSVVWAFSRALT